jgi:hypothetical protein
VTTGSLLGRPELRQLLLERSLPGDPHDASRYLADPATVRAVLEAWCRALPDGGSAERSCRETKSPPPIDTGQGSELDATR